MTLELSNLEKSIQVLSDSYERSEDKLLMSTLDEVTQDVIRSGVIQNFEIVYELSWKYIQRWVKINVSHEDSTSPRTRKELFRTAFKFNLINDPPSWFDYSDARNSTSHTYSRSKADEVYIQAGLIINDATFLLNNLKKYND